MEKILMFMTLIGALLAIVFAALTARKVIKFPVGTEKMKKISYAIREGANAYLKRQYKIVVIFFGVMFAILGAMAIAELLTPYVPFAFLTGGFFSALSGFVSYPHHLLL